MDPQNHLQDLQEHLQDLQEHLQDIQEHLQDHFYCHFEGFRSQNGRKTEQHKIMKFVLLESLWGLGWDPFPALGPRGPLLLGFGSNVLAVLVAPGLDLDLRHQIYAKFIDFWVGKCG